MQVFKAKRDRYDVAFLVMVFALWHHFIHEFEYNPWLTGVSAVLLCYAVTMLFVNKQQLIIDSPGIRLQSVYKRFSGFKLKGCFSVAYADIRHIEVMGPEDSARELNINTKTGEVHTLTLAKYPDLPEIISNIQRFYPFDAKPVQLFGRSFEPERKTVSDVQCISVLLFAAAIFATDLLSSWHPKYANFGLLAAKFAPLTFFLVYLYIRGENRHEVRKVFLLPAIVLSTALSWASIALNRHYTEHYGYIRQEQFVLVPYDGKWQKWYLLHDFKRDKNNFYLTPYSQVDYQPDLKPGYVYAIQVKTGYLNDWVFAPDAFKNAKEIRKIDIPSDKGLE